ncbi:caspase-3-like isoform X2 [Saccostrea echinata]|uniref:caspase-3-like isoform X2 n=1 Tax=Saccostrea echinata TaxID=191078 RepID=UPI002A7ED72E|nr:caspase-3-like isoform X2 [Saccostrea echinata]
MAPEKIPQEARDLHNKLITNLHDFINSKVDAHDFEKVKHRLKMKLPPYAIMNCNNVLDIVEKLQKKGHVKPGHYDDFIKLIECIDVTWVDEINERAEEIKKIIAEANRPQTAESSEENKKLDGKKRKLEEDNQESLSEKSDGPTQKKGAHSSKKRRYSRDEKQKGLALILNFTKGREGTEADFRNIHNFFEKTLNFECHVEHDTTKQDLMEFLEETAGLFNNRRKAADYYCLLVFIMSHGNEEGIITDDDKTISLDEIVAYFKNDKLKYFAGKPKCFFVQACRGKSPQGTVDLSDDKEEVMIDQVVGKISTATDADLLMAYATTSGYFAWRRPHLGSWFFHNVIKIFKDNYLEEHMEDMLIDVKEALAYDPQWQTNTGHKQMPCTWSTLTKRFYLAPGQSPE